MHTAPAHGPEDYLVGVDNDLDLSCPVGEDGRYTSSVVRPDVLANKEVLTEGSEKIMELFGKFLAPRWDYFQKWLLL